MSDEKAIALPDEWKDIADLRRDFRAAMVQAIEQLDDQQVEQLLFSADPAIWSTFIRRAATRLGLSHLGSISWQTSDSDTPRGPSPKEPPSEELPPC